MIEEALFAILTDGTIGALLADRENVFPDEIPQGKKRPAVTYTRSGGNRDYDMEGATGFGESRFIISAHAEGNKTTSAYSQAKKIARAIEAKFNSAGAGYHQVGSTQIQSIFIVGENDSRGDTADGKGAARVNLDCTVFHREV